MPERDVIEGASSPLIAGPRAAEAPPSALTAQRLRRGSLAASLALHAGALLALVLIALWVMAPPPDTTVVRVTLSDAPGAAGASGGDTGGGPTEASSAPAEVSRAAPAPSAAPPEAAAEPPPPPAPAPEQVAAAPPPPLPRPPRRKPVPPQPAAIEAEPSPAPASAALAAGPPAATPGVPGEAGGPGGAAGAGTGAEGAGHGAIGDGPIEGPGDDYLEQLRAWLSRYKQYPEQAKQEKQQGRLVVSFTILRDGTVRDARIAHSSGFPLLDQAALRMLHDASPVPSLPDSYRGEHASVDLPVDFSIGLLDRFF